MVYDQVIEDFIDIYVEIFTEKELKDILKFYKTKTGKKFVEVLPDITQKSMLVGTDIFTALEPKIMKYAEEFQNDLMIIISQELDENKNSEIDKSKDSGTGN